MDHVVRDADYNQVNAAFGFSDRGSNSVSIPASQAQRREYVERAGVRWSAWGTSMFPGGIGTPLRHMMYGFA
jgi:hypothetical protein